MPKAPNKWTALRDIREETRMDLGEFAKMLGLKYRTCQRYELGLLKITPAVAENVMRATGADATALLNGAAVDLSGKPYTHESFAKWTSQAMPGAPFNLWSHGADPLMWKKGAKKPEVDPDRVADALCGWMKILFRAAKEKGRLRQVSDYIAECLTDAREHYGLEKATNRILNDYEVTVTLHLTKEQLIKREGKNPTLGEALGFKVPERILGQLTTLDQVFEVPITSKPGWTPGHYPPPPTVTPPPPTVPHSPGGKGK